MAPRRWTFGHLVAVFELACGVGIALWFVVLGATPGAPDRTALDIAFPFVVAALALLVLGGWALRSWREAERTGPRPATAGPVREPGPAPHPPASAAGPPGPPPAPPELSPEGRRELARIVAVLAGAGILGPRIPEPDELVEAVADQGEPVTAMSVLDALHEAEYYHPGFRIEDHTGALAFHGTGVEQDEPHLRRQVADLDRLTGAVLTVAAREVDLRFESGRRAVPTRIGLVLDGRPVPLDYAGAAKRLSTVLHTTVARALADTSVRLAWLWGDAGAWIAALPRRTDLARLNADLDAPEHERWEWIDEQQPYPAGAG